MRGIGYFFLNYNCALISSDKEAEAHFMSIEKGEEMLIASGMNPHAFLIPPVVGQHP